MPRSLAELRAEAKPRALERSYSLCLAQDLVARVQSLCDERDSLAFEIGTSTDEDGKPKKPRRANDPRQARIAEIDTELETLYEEMRDHTGELILRATSAGLWRRWVEENPPRIADRDAEGRPILNPVDENVAYGICDATALLEDLHRYVVSWNGEPVSADDFAYLVDNAAPGDVKEVCRIVVQLHEAAGARAPKASSLSSSTTTTPETS